MTARTDRAAQLRERFDRGFAEPLAPPAPATHDYLRVRIGGAPYAIALAEIAALHADLRVVALPSPARELLGIAAVRAALVPIYDLRLAIGAAADGAPRWTVLLRGAPAGFAFDGFDGHARTHEDARGSGATSTGATSMPATNIVTIDGRDHPVIALVRVLDEMRRRWPVAKEKS